MSTGKVGYDAYKESTGVKTYDGRDMPTWEQVQANTPHVAKAWERAADAVVGHYLSRVAGEPFDFGTAINLLKLGKKVARAGWNGKGMWIALTPGGTVDAHQFSTAMISGAIQKAATEVRVATAGGTGHLKILSRIDMRAADGALVIGWLASQTDMLADDWMLAE